MLVQAYFWVALGSALGGMARFWLTGVGARLFGETFPWGTLLINIIGSFVIGLFVAMTVPEGRFVVEPDFRAFVTVGLCGGFTTFSAFSLQTMVLMQEGQWLAAGGYIAASVLLCLLAVWAGYAIAMQLNPL
ncbi:fluoride efflux transporter CrcB [Hyphomicrobium sulfonivorans]|uniref:fluoride efflux transporter CrcB n=1 Tax=Hyphomicrobium sulfonivorans TaxID=121290 RepID=UPI00156E2054|nr:fluoride efflux transporter CrcB [Hyphomicrobium sulfonivorans]NSL73192.1 fluoride efflux transporter CrcB [Hyphomicrobium sulfonivorans]